MYLFTLTDWYCAMYSVTFIALIECIIIAWIYGKTWTCPLWRGDMEIFPAALALCDGNPWWRQMEIFSALMAPCEGGFAKQRPVPLSFEVFFDLSLNKRLRNNKVAGDLRRHRVHYDVIIMLLVTGVCSSHSAIEENRLWCLCVNPDQARLECVKFSQ